MQDKTRRTEKLTSAIYLLTSFFDDKEPMKWKLRALASELVSMGMLIKDNMFAEREAVISKIRNHVSEITVMLAVSKDVGLISLPNYDLIIGEFKKYVDSFDYSQNISDFLGLGKEVPRTEKIEKDEFVRSESSYEFGETRRLPSPAQKDKILKDLGAVYVKKNSRQSTIISLLKRKKEATIKDITPLIQGCSEKTVQRELIAMVQSGLLKRVGEKRWSRYSLAHS